MTRKVNIKNTAGEILYPVTSAEYIEGLNEVAAKKAAEAVAKVVADAPEDLDTLKEISEWISSHNSSAASMNAAISTKAEASVVKELSEKVDGIEGIITFKVYTKDEVNALIAAGAIDSAEKLQAAFDAGTPYIKLAGDVAGNFTVPETAECTLDLGHFKIENDGDHTITVNGKLTICGDGIIDNLTHTKAPLVINGTVILENGMITRSLENGQSDKDPGGNSYYAILNHGKFYMYGGKVIANGKYSSVIDNGWYTPSENLTGKNAECYIYNGILDGGLNTLKNDDYGVMKLYGGIIGFNSYTCAILNWNLLDIYSGVIGTGSSGENYSVITKGDRSLGYEDGTTNVYGGTFIGTLRQDDVEVRYNKFGLYQQ